MVALRSLQQQIKQVKIGIVSALHTTLPAGTTLFMNVTAITLTSGVGIGYHEGVTT